MTVQFTGVLHNKSELAHCRSCAEPMLFLYSTELRDFCHSCSIQNELDAYNEAKRITRNRRRDR